MNIFTFLFILYRLAISLIIDDKCYFDYYTLVLNIDLSKSNAYYFNVSGSSLIISNSTLLISTN